MNANEGSSCSMEVPMENACQMIASGGRSGQIPLECVAVKLFQLEGIPIKLYECTCYR